MYVCIPHLVAVHLVAMFEGKCFAQGNVDGVAHNGYRKSVAYHLWEQCGIWGTGSLEPGAGGKDEWFRFVSLLSCRVLTHRRLYKKLRALGQLTLSQRLLIK